LLWVEWRFAPSSASKPSLNGQNLLNLRQCQSSLLQESIFSIANQPIRPMFHSKTIVRALLGTERL
jgi:membrane glycosyltransferase